MIISPNAARENAYVVVMVSSLTVCKWGGSRCSDNRYSDSRYSDNRYFDSRYSENRYSDSLQCLQSCISTAFKFREYSSNL
jgi:hypothetical protein